jgi:ceramide glucosyltransferase
MLTKNLSLAMTHLHQLLIELPLNTALKGTGHYFMLLLLLLCLSALGYYCYAIYAANEFFCQPTKTGLGFYPPISILKPMCGLDSNAYENLASFCCQDYPEYQIIFSVRDQHDPSLVVVKQIINNFPEMDIQLIVCKRTIGMNLKVSNLANAQAFASYSVLLIADSDIWVGSQYGSVKHFQLGIW